MKSALLNYLVEANTPQIFMQYCKASEKLSERQEFITYIYPKQERL